MRLFRLAEWAIPLWREPGVLQLGLSAGCPVIKNAPPAALRVLQALAEPRRASDLYRIAPTLAPEWLDSLLAGLTDAGALKVSEPQQAREVLIAGSGELAKEIHRLLSFHPVAISWLRGTGSRLPSDARIRLVHDWEAALDRPDLTIVAPRTIEHDRALSDWLTSEGLDHLVIRSENDRVVVGPLTVVGWSPCTRCLDLSRRDRDPAWPYLLAQLALRQAKSQRPLAAWAAATAVSQAMCFLTGGTPDSVGRTLELAAPPGKPEAREWGLHRACDCVQQWSAMTPSTASA